MFVNQVCSVVVTELVSGEKPSRYSKELGEVFVSERRKWKDTKGEGYTPCNHRNCTTNLLVPGVQPGYLKFLLESILAYYKPRVHSFYLILSVLLRMLSLSLGTRPEC